MGNGQTSYDMFVNPSGIQGDILTSAATVVLTSVYAEIESWRQGQHEIAGIEQAKGDRLAAVSDDHEPSALLRWSGT